MDAGRVRLAGTTNEVLSQYLRFGEHSDGIRMWDKTENTQDPRFKIRAVRILATDGNITGHIDIRKPFTIEVEYQILETLPQFRLGIKVVTSDGTIAFSSSDSMDPDYDEGPRVSGFYTACCFIPANLLNESLYNLTISADIPFKAVLFLEDGAVGFSVEQIGSLSARFPEKWPGVVCPHLKWQTRLLQVL